MIAIRSAKLQNPSATTVRVRRKLTGRKRLKSTAPLPPSTASTEGTATLSSNASSSSVPIGASLMAAVAGVGVVSAAASIIEQATANSCLPFDTTSGHGQRFDQSTYWGRFARMLLACDPALLRYDQKEVRAAQQELSRAAQRQNSASPLSPSESRNLWEAKRIVDSALHPDTGEVIPRPFRMSGYVPYNGPICVSMVASTSTMPLLFWSWVNQSQNALVNYYVSLVHCKTGNPE